MGNLKIKVSMKIIKYLYYILTQKQRSGAFFQFLLMIISMFFELISIGMLVPVVTIISSHDLGTKFPQLALAQLFWQSYPTTTFDICNVFFWVDLLLENAIYDICYLG